MMEFEDHPTEPNTIVIKMPKYHIAKYTEEELQAAVLAERKACAEIAKFATMHCIADAIMRRGESDE